LEQWAKPKAGKKTQKKISYLIRLGNKKKMKALSKKNLKKASFAMCATKDTL
jgi:hypothetical protein